MFTLFIDLALALVAALMILKGHYGITRQLAAVPLAVALVDAAFAAQLQLSLTPVISALLIALQVVILAASGEVLREDMVRARNKMNRRRRREELARSRAAFEQAAQRRDRMRQAACA